MMRRRLATMGAAMLLAVSGSVMTAPAASAEAHGFTGIPPHSFVSHLIEFKVPAGGVMLHSIFGSGRTATRQEATAGGVRLCYPRIDFVALKSGDAYHSRVTGTEIKGCTSQAKQWRGKHTYPTNVRKDCARYHANGVKKAEKCFSIN